MVGIGSLLGNPLDPYRQYLQQTYTQPQGQQRLDLFIDQLRQQEQEFFGAPSAGSMQPVAAPNLNPLDPYDGMRSVGLPFPGLPATRTLGALQPASGAAVNQRNLASSQTSAPSSAPAMTLGDAFSNKFGSNWADQFSLTTPSNRSKLFGNII